MNNGTCHCGNPMSIQAIKTSKIRKVGAYICDSCLDKMDIPSLNPVIRAPVKGCDKCSIAQRMGEIIFCVCMT